MTTRGFRDDVVVLAGTSEVRVVDSTTAAERVLASGFRPAVVLLGSGLCAAGASDFARRMGTDPDRAAIPLLTISGGADQIRLRPFNEDLEPPSELEALTSLLEVLDELCSGPMQLAV